MKTKTKTKAGRRALYELMAKKVGDDSFGNTELLATISLDELKTVERIAKALANDNSGRLLAILKTHMDFLERPATAVSREVLLRAREMAARASKAKHPRGCKAQQPDDPERLVEIQKLYERGRALVNKIGADDRKTAGQSLPK